MEAPARQHRRLIWKYTTVVVALVAAAIVSVGLTELYFSYQDSKRALTRAEQDKAFTAAASIEQTIEDVVVEIESVAQPTTGTGEAGLVEREQDFAALLLREELISTLSYLDAAGRSGSGAHWHDVDRLRQRDRLLGECGIRAHAEGDALLRPGVFERPGSQPQMTIAVAEPSRRGVVVAEIDLSFVGDVVNSLSIGTAGYAYAVDPRGVLITHQDIDLVLRGDKFDALPQVRAVLAAAASGPTNGAMIGRDPEGTEVLSAFQTIE